MTRIAPLALKIKRMEQEDKTEVVIGAFYEVYNVLGYGFIEAVYQNALCKEFQRLCVPYETHRKIDVFYKGEPVGYYEADIIVYGSIILELKAVKQLMFEHERQLRNYLKATDLEIGLLLNFGPKPEIKREVFSSSYRERLRNQDAPAARSASSASSAGEK